MLEIKTLEKIPTEQIWKTFNLAFSDYIVPLQLSLEQLQAKLKVDNIQFDLSVGAFYNNELVGYILHGQNKHRIYNGGTGVISSQRGQKLTQKMYDFILPKLIQNGIKTLILEVISSNIPAIKSYKKVGFQTTRKLNCYKGTIKTLSTNDNIDIRSIHRVDWTAIKLLWEIQPSWQNAPQSIDLIQSRTVLGAYLDNKLVGYAIHTQSRLHQLFVKPRFRRQKIASTLIQQICKITNRQLSVINVDDSALVTNTFLENIGLENFLVQLEMEYQL